MERIKHILKHLQSTPNTIKPLTVSDSQNVEIVIFDGTNKTTTLDEAASLLVTGFTTQREPMVHHISPRDFDFFVRGYLQHAIKEKISLIAKKNGKLVGICVNIDFFNEEDDSFLNGLWDRNFFGFKIIFESLTELKQPFVDEMKNRNLDQYGIVFDVFIGAVDPHFGKQGILKELVKKSKIIAKKRGYKYISAVTTNTFSLNAALKNDGKIINTLKYDKFEYPKGSGIFPYKGIQKITGFDQCYLVVDKL